MYHVGLPVGGTSPHNALHSPSKEWLPAVARAGLCPHKTTMYSVRFSWLIGANPLSRKSTGQNFHLVRRTSGALHSPIIETEMHLVTGMTCRMISGCVQHCLSRIPTPCLS